MNERGFTGLRQISTPLPTREEGGTDEYLKHVKKVHGPESAEKVREILKTLGLGQMPDEIPPDPALYDKPGEQSETAATHILSLLWVGRGTRPDAMTAIGRLASRLSNWTAYEDKLLERLFRYMWHTRYLCLEMEAHPDDASFLMALALCDSDHGGDLVDTKATTGYGCFIAGPRTHSLCAWASRHQPNTGKSTGDCECAAISECVSTSAEALRTLMEQLYSRETWCVVRSDADVAISAIMKGYSRKMSYLRRTQKVSLGFLHDYFGCENTQLEKVPGEKNDSDILTKGLDHVAHWRHCTALGMRPSILSQA
jgi:hypothetical protein